MGMLNTTSLCREIWRDGTRAVTIWNAQMAERGDSADDETPPTKIQKPLRRKRFLPVTKLETSKVERAIRWYMKQEEPDARLGKGGIIYATSVLDTVAKKLLTEAVKYSVDNIICTESLIKTLQYDYDLKKLFHELFI
ncbi:Hypothetical protein POVR1_LOCUS543 [uncultured virus]|nr:Hypothetical protein POVR1_LOCUS543 [uncultured virus]